MRLASLLIITFFSYRAYWKSADYYISALHTKCFANAPHLYVGQQVSVSVKPRGVKIKDDGYHFKAGLINVIYHQVPEMKHQVINGVLEERQNGQLFIEIRE